jgi:hypothetical protein
MHACAKLGRNEVHPSFFEGTSKVVRPWCLANLAGGTVVEDIVGIEIGGGSKRVLGEHVGNVFLLSYIFWFCIIHLFLQVSKVLRALNLCDKTCRS